MGERAAALIAYMYLQPSPPPLRSPFFLCQWGEGAATRRLPLQMKVPSTAFYKLPLLKAPSPIYSPVYGPTYL